MDLFLVRHAIAESRDPRRWPDDSLRPLTPDGVERFRRAVQGLIRLVPSVEFVLSSPYVRAWSTAELLHETGGWPSPEACEALAAEESPQTAVAAVLEHEAASVAVVGHEPYLSSLASLLLAGSEDAARIELKKGGVLFLSREGVVAPGTALLRWSLSPKILRALAPPG
jgi:phosphohistidine phosphatase